MSREFSIEWNVAGAIESLTFDLADETFALEARLVREIIDPLPETRVPGSAALVPSIINFRGRVVPVADLRLAFDLPEPDLSENSRIIVIDIELSGHAMQIGIKVDRVHEVSELLRSDAEDLPSLGLGWRPEFIRCLIRRNATPIIVPNLESIFVNLCGKKMPARLSMH